jgi:hypothetical protein
MVLFRSGSLMLLMLYLAGSIAFAQNQNGFYDEYNMDLRNLPGSDSNSDDAERFSTYTIPSKNEKNFVVTPKKVGRIYDPLLSIPMSGNMQNTVNQSSNQNVNQAQNPNKQAPLINPLTGSVDESALQNSIANRDKAKDKKARDKKKFVEESVYKESKYRRFQIIFFLTMPFALGVSAGAASLMGIEKAISGSILMISGTAGLSGANAYQDLQKLDDYKKKHGTEWHTEEDNIITTATTSP